MLVFPFISLKNVALSLKYCQVRQASIFDKNTAKFSAEGLKIEGFFSMSSFESVARRDASLKVTLAAII